MMCDKEPKMIASDGEPTLVKEQEKRAGEGDRLLFQSQEHMPATGRKRVHLDGERIDWSDLIGNEDRKN